MIWSGHGLIIPFLAIAGFIGGSTAGVYLADSEKVAPLTAMCYAIMGSGAGLTGLLWAYALTVGKTETHISTSRVSQREYTSRESHSFLFIPARGWAFLGTIVGGILMATGFFLEKGGPIIGEKGSAQLALHQAEVGLVTQNEQFKGNSQAAGQMMHLFNQFTKQFQEAANQANPALPPSEDVKFFTFCQASEYGTAFIVHVPELRKYNRAAKEAFARAVWSAAQSTVEFQKPTPAHLAVAVRGLLIYDNIMLGRPVPGLRSDPSAGIEREVSTHTGESLHPFFDMSQLPTPVTSPVSPYTTLPTSVREWKSSDGRVMRASLIRFSDDLGLAADFKREDGEVFNVPVGRFSEETQAELRALHSGQPKP